MSEAIEIAERNPEFEYGTTARIEVRPIKTKEKAPIMCPGQSGLVRPDDNITQLK